MLRGLDLILLRGRRPGLVTGALAIATGLVVCTLLIYPLTALTRPASLGVVYLLGVVVVSIFWGLWMGVAMAVLSAAAFNFFHLPPVGHFTIVDSRNWAALGTFLVASVAVSSVSELARRRFDEALRRRAEADLTAEMAGALLACADLEEALTLINRQIAGVFELASARVVLGERAGDAGCDAIALPAGGERVGTLLIPAATRQHTRARIGRAVVPPLSVVLQAARERERLAAEAVKAEGLRRSEAVKTAVLRAVSHDLRTPLTAMITAGAAVRAAGITAAERDELGGLVQQEGTRLARLIDDLLDLSRLEANAASPQLAECSVEEVIDSALASQPAAADLDVQVADDLKPVRADFVQLERAVANILENAVRYSGDRPVVVRARERDDQVTIRISDHGPGISPADQARIFEPFYRGAQTEHAGSGLGLAIARGFVETNGGQIRVESAAGRGSVFVIEIPTVATGGAG